MILSRLKIAACVLLGACGLQAATPDISNLNNCINDVRNARNYRPSVPTFDAYASNYSQLLDDLHAAAPNLPHVYQQIAANPLIQFLQNLGERQFLQIFAEDPTDDYTAVLQQILPDAVLAILSYQGAALQGVNAFQEVVSDLYDGFLSDEVRVSQATGMPIAPPTYGVIPPLVKFGNSDAGPYTWPGDATKQILGMGCGVVSLPPEQLQGGLLAWTSLGHETGGHDVTHADQGLLDELAQKVYVALLKKFNSASLAKYWANCIDETTADVCGYLNMGPSFGVGLIGYFRGLENGKLRTVGSVDDPHPIDLLRGYLGAAVVKRLHFQDNIVWSQVIRTETRKDDGSLYLVNDSGQRIAFPVPFAKAVASADVVAQTIMRSKLQSLQGHSLQELQDWKDADQAVVNNLASILKTGGQLPMSLQGPGFYAAYVIAAATQAALQKGANIPQLFREMQSFLATMHRENPTWSTMPTSKSMALLEHALKESANNTGVPRVIVPRSPEPAIH